MLFFSMTRLTPSSPLFPYTTLFRSLQVRLPPGHHAARDAHRLARRAQGAGRDALRGAGAVRGRPGPLRLGHEEADRKSTRLNSSHANISYAVFCLKKKRTHQLRTDT